MPFNAKKKDTNSHNSKIYTFKKIVEDLYLDVCS